MKLQVLKERSYSLIFLSIPTTKTVVFKCMKHVMKMMLLGTREQTYTLEENENQI